MTADETAATGAADTSATDTASTETATNAATPDGSEGNTAATDTSADTTDTNEVSGVPEAYEFALPDGMTLDQGLLDKTTPVLKELGLSNEQASKLVAAYAEHMKGLGEGAEAQAEQWYQERRQAEIVAANEAGIAAIKADPEIGGGNFDAVRSRVIEAVGAKGTPELRATFDKHGLANDPEVVRFIHRLIDYTPTDRGERAASGGGTHDVPLEARMYPSMNK